ncbi:putative Mg2+ transporter-like zinc transport protein [Rhypophila sp. PSN 637]
MDQILFLSELDSGRITEKSRQEATKWLEILNHADDLPRQNGIASKSTAPEPAPNALNEGGLDKFLSRQHPFPSGGLENVTSGIRLIIQQEVKAPRAFFPGSIPFRNEQFKLVVEKMRLPLEVIDGTSVVGPFFWWGYMEDFMNPGDGHLRERFSAAQSLFIPQTLTWQRRRHSELVFRKSDVQWKGTSRGWEMALSYSTATRITSGYIRGTLSAGIHEVIELVCECARPACHPLLLPLLMLRREMSPQMEIDQRDIRDQLRSMETAVSKRYTHVGRAAPGYVETAVGLDSVNRTLADYQCKAMGKKPQAWITAIRRMEEAMDKYWALTGPSESEPEAAVKHTMLPDIQMQHKTISRRLGFMIVRLEGLESYTQVTLERLNIQREVQMNSIISQRESRLSLAIAAQQRRIAHTTGRDSTSMKTLTILGVMFLPGAFLSSVFGMSFFDFSGDIYNSVSPRLYIFFVIVVPLTIIIIVVWRKFDQQSTAEADTEVSDMEMNKLEERIMEAIRDRTGARVTTGFSDNRAPVVQGHGAVPLPGANSSNGKTNRGFFGFLMPTVGKSFLRSNPRDPDDPGGERQRPEGQRGTTAGGIELENAATGTH